MRSKVQEGKRWRRWLFGLAVLGLVAAGCGGDDSGDDTAAEDTPADESAPDDTEAPDDSTTTTGPPTTTTEAPAEVGVAQCSDTTPDCTGSITPAEGLADGDEVTIEATGFDPNLDLGITQCIAEEDPDNGLEPGSTGAEVCNLRDIGTITSDADGNVSGTFNVAAGQTMVDNTQAGVTCDATHDCVVSVGELIPDPDAQRVTFLLNFA